MTGTRELERKTDAPAAPHKIREDARPDSHPCGGCNSCHEMTRIHGPGAMMGWAGEGGGGTALRKPCATGFFQRNLGNSFFQAMPSASRTGSGRIQRKCDCGGSCDSCAGKEDETGKIQAKLAVGAPNDIYEQEADRVADSIAASSLDGSGIGADMKSGQFGQAESGFVQRVENTREIVEVPDEVSLLLPPVPEGGEEVRAKLCGVNAQKSGDSFGPSQPANADGDAVIERAVEGGSTFNHPVKSYMERSFGADLSGVKMHADSRADDACRSINARAFTLGQHIVFAKGEYQPDSSAGNHLLAHELTHVIQQREGLKPVVRRQTSCLPGAALPYAGYCDPSHNCYAYALNSPSAGMITPGYTSGRPYGGMNLWDKNTYTFNNVLTLTEGDLGGGRSGCCTSDSTRMIVEVVTDNATHVAARSLPGGALAPVPMVGSKYFDFHWYRQDADGMFSHKPGRNCTSREDAGTAPIADPYVANRSYSYADYRNAVATWCL